ncbi:MAG: VOC family protein [Methylomonas sp.]
MNRPTTNLSRSMAFFSRRGLTFNPPFTYGNAVRVIVSATVFGVSFTQEKFKTFTPIPVCDATKNAEVPVCQPCESRHDLHELGADGKV